ncbi:MAG: hypothetical protein IIA45_02580 [Bacteroidetes bacterium]|nr:hypothetical protein [Bacteroidota bacterium]
MKTLKTTSIVILIIMINTVAFSKTSLEMGKEWWAKRADGAVGTNAKTGPISNAINYFEKAIKNRSVEEEVAIELIRSYYFKATFVPMSKDRRKEIYNKGRIFGENMIKKYPDSAPLKFWLAAHWGKWAQAYGALAAAKEGVADKIRSLSEDVIRLDPTYYDGGGYQILGLVHQYTPRIPFLLTWPSNNEALIYMKRATKISPNHIGNNFCLAKLLFKKGQRVKAIIILEKTVKLKPRQNKLIEDRYSIAQAEALLKKIKG